MYRAHGPEAFRPVGEVEKTALFAQTATDFYRLDLPS